MTIRANEQLCNNMANDKGFCSSFNGGRAEVRSGPQPSSADGAVTGTLLGYITQADGSGLQFVAVGRTAMKVPTDKWQFTGLANGTIGWIRLCGPDEDNGSANVPLPRLDLAAARTGADFDIPNLEVTVGSIGSISDFQFTIPKE